jgi:hypothetical protein
VTTRPNRRFGVAWLVFAAAISLHVVDEASHNFLSVYNPSVQAIRARLPFLPLPTFTFRVWLATLAIGITVFLCFAPFAFRGGRRIRAAGVVIGLVPGILNASLHIGSSIYYHRWMPGVYSSPILLVAAIVLLVGARDASKVADQIPAVS